MTWTSFRSAIADGWLEKKTSFEETAALSKRTRGVEQGRNILPSCVRHGDAHTERMHTQQKAANGSPRPRAVEKIIRSRLASRKMNLDLADVLFRRIESLELHVIKKLDDIDESLHALKTRSDKAATPHRGHDDLE
jgi:hypothetical protein